MLRLLYRVSRLKNGILLGLLGCLLPTLASAAIARVNSATAVCAGTDPCTITYSPVANHLLIVAIMRSDTTSLATPTDNATGGSSTYVQQYNDAVSTFNRLGLFYSTQVKSGVTTVSIANPAASNMAITVIEYSGTATSSPVDVASAQATGTGVTATSASVTTTNSGDVLVGHFGNITATNTWTVGTNYGNLVSNPDAAGGYTQATEDRLPGSSGAFTASAGEGNVDATWAAYIVSFKPAASGPPVGQRPRVY
jgi:hypothetical protein